MRAVVFVLLGVLGMAAVAAGGVVGEATVISLDPAAWEAVPADGVGLRLMEGVGPGGRPALRLDFDFGGRGGWAAARYPVDLELPESFELRFALRGEGTANHLEVKLVDPSGDNVWWHVQRELEWPEEWTPARIKQRQISFAWGPLPEQERIGGPTRIGAIEIAITAGGGGDGSVWLADLAVTPVEAARPPEGPPEAESSSAQPGYPASAALDGERGTSWRPAAAAFEGRREAVLRPEGAGAGPVSAGEGSGASLTVDLRGQVELGGLSLYWEPGRSPERFRVELSEDGGSWEAAREVGSAGAPESHLRLPDAEAQLLRLVLDAGACPAGCGLAELTVRPLAFGESPNAFFEALAREAPRGAYPRGFSGEAVYWTVVGLPVDPQEGLLSEDGALEGGERAFSLEPFLFLERNGEGYSVPERTQSAETPPGRMDRRLWTWADVEAEQSLAERDLPLPTVTWRLPGARMELSVLPIRDPLHAGFHSTLLARYRVTNEGAERLRGRLFLAVRPFQVNPPYQFLNVAGGVAPIHSLECTREGLRVDAEQRLWTAPLAAACGAQTFDRGRLTDALAAGRVPADRAAADPVGAASAALAWELDLAPGEAKDSVVALPLSREATAHAVSLAAGGPAAFAAAEAEARRWWRAALGPLELDLPAAAEPLARTLRSSLAWILVHQDLAALQPGSRAYARSWIRDGALTGSALLRFGHAGAARAFAEWFAGFQYPDGKVPCCVDRRGADPVPEHDSHGQLVHLIAEVYRFTGDRAFAERMFPHAAAAVAHIEALRQERRTPEYRKPERLAFFGLLPESISHEGYAAKPVHSYWDDVFAHRGLDDAVGLALTLGRPELAAEWARRRDELRADLLASIERVRTRDRLAYIPGSADLGDFDSTATTVALDPGGLGPHLPAAALEATFERFWSELGARRAGSGAWDAYTPYEIRHVGAFVRLGGRWRARAHELLDAYLADRRPVGWNGWPEVVTRDPREPRFLGDLPHGWVASDFIRSVLDLFAYEDRDGRALVLGAGVPEGWLAAPEGIAVRRLGTPWGELSYRLARLSSAAGGGVRYRLEAPPATGRPLRAPPGGLVFTWPLAGSLGEALVDGRPVEIGADGRVVVHGVPTTVDLLPREVQ
jgi:hypothetical protein